MSDNLSWKLILIGVVILVLLIVCLGMLARYVRPSLQIVCGQTPSYQEAEGDYIFSIMEPAFQFDGAISQVIPYINPKEVNRVRLKSGVHYILQSDLLYGSEYRWFRIEVQKRRLGWKLHNPEIKTPNVLETRLQSKLSTIVVVQAHENYTLQAEPNVDVYMLLGRNVDAVITLNNINNNQFEMYKTPTTSGAKTTFWYNKKTKGDNLVSYSSKGSYSVWFLKFQK